MSLIRREEVPAPTRFAFNDLERQARAIIASAQEQARTIVTQAEAQAREIMAQARQAEAERARAGYERGLVEGRAAGAEQIERETRAAAQQAATAEARERIDQLTRALQSALAGFEGRKQGVLAAAEMGLVELALAIARRVCRYEVARSSEPAKENVRAVLDLMRHENDLELHVHPEEQMLLAQVAQGFVQATGRLRHVQVVADARVARGGCVLHTRHGTLDSSLETQLDRVAEALCGRTAEFAAGESAASPSCTAAAGVNAPGERA